MDLGLGGKVAIVTGSGRGIGRGIAMTLAAEGACVGVNDYYLDRAEATAGKIRDAGGKAIALQADVTQTGQVEQMANRAASKWGTVHILVNNAGIPAGVLETDPLSIAFLVSDAAEWVTGQVLSVSGGYCMVD
jgi:3-oxoacyl-[acyl-carrier protein] reductase